ncbi:MAG TPA: guanylate kinase [Lachnospiraceae bacterium]|nr:guanylate kinase [Lachnospiraceae bacterium]
MKERGILLVVSGFAGSGKGTLMKELLKRYDNYALSVSATTRSPRPGEINGVDYFFVTTENFENMVAKNELLEHAKYVSNYYGTPRGYVEEQLQAGKDVLLEIEIQGALIIKEKYPEALLLFVIPPSVQEVYGRLKKRGTETKEVIASRMRRAKEEAEMIGRYDYLIINDDLDTCVQTLHHVVMSAHCAVFRNYDTINKIKRQFVDFLEGE